MKINWKIFYILLVLSLISVVCILPYVITIQGDLLKQIKTPLVTIFIAQFFQSIILFSVVNFLGLLFTNKTGFKFPLLEAIVKKGDYKKIIKSILLLSVSLGFGVAVAIYILDYLFTLMGAGITTHGNHAPIWQTLLAAFYGGITEEILMRLFLMSFFIWLGMKIFRQKKASKIGIIFSIFLAAIIFGLGHLPITSSLTKINPLVISRAIVLNSVAGIVFGWLFWKKGLESAMISHFTADIFLLTVLPLLIK